MCYETTRPGCDKSSLHFFFFLIRGNLCLSLHSCYDNRFSDSSLIFIFPALPQLLWTWESSPAVWAILVHIKRTRHWFFNEEGRARAANMVSQCREMWADTPPPLKSLRNRSPPPKLGSVQVLFYQLSVPWNKICASTPNLSVAPDPSSVPFVSSTTAASRFPRRFSSACRRSNWLLFEIIHQSLKPFSTEAAEHATCASPMWRSKSPEDVRF